MRLRLRPGLVLGLTLNLAVTASTPLAAQAPPAPAPAPQAPAPTTPAVQIIGVEASRVLLDVIVRDGKDNPIRDLTGADFEVYEDGVKQNVDLFEIIRSNEAPAPAPSAPAAAPAPAVAAAPRSPGRPEFNIIAFVFDRLSPDARNLAKQAALTYLQGSQREADRVGVFLIDLSLITLQGYTNEADKIRDAIERAGERATSAYASNRARQRDLLRQTEAGAPAVPTPGGAAGGAAAGAAGADSGAAAVTSQFQQMEYRMSQSFESMERDQQGYSTSNGLMAVVNSMRLMPGRKTVVFFSEGLALPSNVQAHFRAVISEANRANVSVYAMDAAGLRAQSTLDETRQEMIAAARQQIQQRGSGRDYTDGAMSKQLERNEDLLRLDPHSGLGQLAEDTGGFLIRDTNDLKNGFRRIDADMRFYYSLGYEPVSQDYDGRFRKVEVKVKRAGARVRARKGYFAVRRTDDRPVLMFEAPALALLENAPHSNAFPTRAQGLRFPESKRPGLVPVLVEIPGNVLTFTTDEQAKAYFADLVIMARIKDPSGRVVERMSHTYRMTGPKPQQAAARAGEVLFYREAELPPGRYTVETVAYDAEANAGSVRSTELVVPEVTAERPRLSSVVVVKRVERVPADERDPAKPLSFGELLLYPNLGEPVQKATAKELSFFFTVYAARGGAQRPKARIAILKNGTQLAGAPVELPEPDTDGRIQYVFGLPLSQVPTGSYHLRVSVQDDRGQDESLAAFTLQD
jgi:VWFA-related protein